MAAWQPDRSRTPVVRKRIANFLTLPHMLQMPKRVQSGTNVSYENFLEGLKFIERIKIFLFHNSREFDIGGFCCAG